MQVKIRLCYRSQFKILVRNLPKKDDELRVIVAVSLDGRASGNTGRRGFEFRTANQLRMKYFASFLIKRFIKNSQTKEKIKIQNFIRGGSQVVRHWMDNCPYSLVHKLVCKDRSRWRSLSKRSVALAKN